MNDSQVRVFARREKFRQGRCRYAMPWTPCRNQAGDERHAECADVAHVYSRFIAELLSCGGEMHEFEPVLETWVKASLPDDDWPAAAWFHDQGHTWLAIARLIEFPAVPS
jgi:hypothetical protein